VIDRETYRQRAAEVIAEANATLSAPRPAPEVIAEMDLEHRKRWADAERQRVAEAPIVRKVREAPPPRYLTIAAADRRQSAIEKAVTEALAIERLGWQRRVNELERRISELEVKAHD
jgi:hypothetical protein